MRASTTDQDADRAKNELQTFVYDHNVRIASFYTEQLSGAKLERAELARLIEDSHRGDVLLIEKVDRLSRLPFEQWKELKQKLVEAGINIVVLDQPMTHAVLSHSDQQTSMISRVLTEFMIDLAAAMARDDYETRRKPDLKLRENIQLLLTEGKSWSQVQELLGCSRSTIAAVKN